VATSCQIAQLALKHRKNKNGGQRIIVFVGSPVTEEVFTCQCVCVCVGACVCVCVWVRVCVCSIRVSF
jgi:spore maturation protein CgeB